MDSKLKMWNQYPSWEDAEAEWDRGAEEAAKNTPIKHLSKLPSMLGITPETAKNLKWKSMKWMIAKDSDHTILTGFLKHPFRYGYRLCKSLLGKKSYTRCGDFFLYGIKNIEEFQSLLNSQDTLLVVGFSYCHKPFECPSGRFTPDCIHDPDHPVCRQCFIGKAINALPDRHTFPLLIPTIHYVGGKIFEIVHKNPKKNILFIITACEMTLEMFGDWGNMVGIRGIGVRLDGRICNTMKAFELSEEGIKPGLTVVLEDTQQKILDLIRQRAKAL